MASKKPDCFSGVLLREKVFVFLRCFVRNNVHQSTCVHEVCVNVVQLLLELGLVGVVRRKVKVLERVLFFFFTTHFTTCTSCVNDSHICYPHIWVVHFAYNLGKMTHFSCFCSWSEEIVF
jgi:hypothetical protein